MSVAMVRPPCDEVAIRAGRRPPGELGPAPAWALTAAVLGSSLAFIDGTVVNVALPSIQSDLSTDVTGAQWVVESYALTLSALLLVGGALGDRLGRRRVFVAGTALFGVASLLCGAAPSIGLLVAARSLQGCAAAMLTPGSLALISAAYAAEGRGRAIGTWSAMTSITSAAGPLLGGLLVEHASWRWAFLINPPIAAVVVAISLTRVAESRDDQATGRLDVGGALLATLGLGAVVLGLVRSQEQGLGAREVVGELLGGGLLLAAFAAAEARPRRGTAPMLDLGLFRSRPFTTTNLLTFLLYAALSGALFYLPLQLIEVRGLSPALAGAALLPFVGLLSVLSRRTGALADRLGPRPLLVTGPLLAAAGFLLLALGAQWGGGYAGGVLPGVVVLGLGMAVTVAPLTATVMGSVATRHAGAASGVNNAVARTAGLLAIAALGIVLTRGFNASLTQRLDDLRLDPGARAAVEAQRSRLALAAPPPGLDPSQAASTRSAVRGAFDDGFRDAELTAAALAAISAAVAAAGLRGGRRGAPVEVPAAA